MNGDAAIARLRDTHRRRPRLAAFVGVFTGVMFCFLAIGAVLPVLPQYVKGPVRGGDVAVGVVTGAFAFSAVIMRPVGGRLADAHGRRVVVVIGMLIASVAGFLYLLPLGVPGLVVARFVLGVGDGWVFTAGATWIVDLAPERRRGQAIGVFGLAIWGGLTIGPLLGELIKHAGGYDAVWVAAGVLPLLGALVAQRVPDHHEPAEEEADDADAQRPPFVPRGVISPGISLSLANVGYGTMAGFIVLHMHRQGVPEGAAVFTVFAASVVLGRLALGRLPDREGPVRTAFGAGCAEAAGLLVLAVADSLPVAIMGAILMGSGFSLLFPSLALTALGRTDDAQRGAALGAVTAFFDIGVGLGAPVAGLIAALAGGYEAAFVFAALCAAAGAVNGIARRRAPTRQNA